MYCIISSAECNTSTWLQIILFSSINLMFLVSVSLQKLYSRFLINRNSSIYSPLLEPNIDPSFKIGIWFKASFFTAALLALSYIVLGILALSQGVVRSKWDLVKVSFKFFEAITSVVVLFLIIHEKKSGALSHSLPLRMYWTANFLIISAAHVTRLLLSGGDPKFKTEDIFFLAVYAFLFIVSVKGSTGIISLIVEEIEDECNTNMMSGYATASLFSKAVWNWMNPLLCKGYKSPLKMDEIPSLPPDHQAEKMAQLFELNWPTEKSNNPVRRMLLRCFWKDLVFTGFLAMVRLSVIYIGPLLIQNFISFTTGDRSNNIFQGFYLISILLISKVIEVLSDHHFEFLSQKLGLLTSSTLITALYRKGLQLSCSSRQTHGVGQIVNYMEVDCEKIFHVLYELHNLWLMPLRVGVALLLLYSYIGISVLVSLVAVFLLMLLTLFITRKNKVFQFNLQKNQDLRIKAMSELLNAMRVIKFQAWEEHFYDKIQSCRKEEFTWLSKFVYTLSGNLVLLWSIPVGLAALTFGAATLMEVSLDAVTVFTATSIFKLLQEPIQNFPQTLSSVSQAIISLERSNGYLTSRELDEKTVDRDFDDESTIAVEVRDGTFSWEDEGDHHVLEDIDFEIKKGEFAAIVGTVGSGKSSLLGSVLGELRKISSGKVVVRGTTAYVAQTSWLQNATIQDNILFGLEMESEKYNNVIRVCCLEKDLEIMEHGDKTEIGERGINLSGGQKQRIQLARAVYQDCDIYILDDIFSAVDAHTGSEILKECIRGALKSKTILLVTHQVDFLHNADIILVLRDGKIVQSGKYEQLRESGLDFTALIAAHETSMELVEKGYEEAPKSVPQNDEIMESTLNENKADKVSSKLIDDEERETGRISLNVYKQYCTEAYGWWGVVAVILTSLFWQFFKMASDYWLAYETSQDRIYMASLFIGIYSSLGFVSCVFVAIRSLLVTFLGLKTAQSFFDQILNSILHAPMSFFDTTPSGRVLSRASSDQANVDMGIPIYMSLIIVTYLSLLGILVITCQYAWPTIFIVIPLIWLNIWYQGYYIASSRELTRLNQITEAPILDHLSETLSGAMTIRCFRKQNEFFEENIGRVNSNLRMSFHNIAANEWLGFRVELFGSFLLCISTMTLIFLPSTIIKPEYVGLSLSYGLSLNSVLYSISNRVSFLENTMVSVERIKQFINIPSEAAWTKPNSLAPSINWPDHGHIEIKELQVRYRENTPLVLKGISLSIDGGEKVGVVGRTGSGKSTLIQVLFRLVEPFSGEIIIDGMDICKLGLHDLRSRFGIIPQEPVLFEGTVRSNIDPFGLYSDVDIWKCLEHCQLKDVVSSKPEKLDASVVDSGENWSVGQRQLLCLGRVMLKRSKILFMDEATASVDAQTDGVIQNIIRQQDFSSCTIITIAHRIPTVLDCDKVLVIDDGWVKEFDNPSNLLGRPSLFGALVQEYANRASS